MIRDRRRHGLSDEEMQEYHHHAVVNMKEDGGAGVWERWSPWSERRRHQQKLK